MMSLPSRVLVFASAILAIGAATAPPPVVSAESVVHWAPRGISSPLFESHAAFDPLTADLLFVRSSKEFRGWHILGSHCGPDGWTDPQPAAFTAPGLEADPVFTANGRWIYFISTRATGSTNSQDLDIWRIKRDPTGK
jgi:hypothetical protein